MDEISKEVDEWYIPLNEETGCFHYFKGHNLDKNKIKHYLQEEYGELPNDNWIFKETYAHWCMVNYDGERQRWLMPNRKYKGVRGGFKITEVELISS